MKKIKLYLLSIAILLGIGGAVASSMTTPGSKMATTTSYYSTWTETWVSHGHPANDQDITHYQTIIGPYHCDPSNNVCTYYVDANGVIRQNEKGDFKQP